MVDFERTSFFFVVTGAVMLVISARNSVARVTVVSVAMTEPERYRAAELAFEVNVLIAVLLAVFDASAYRGC